MAVRNCDVHTIIHKGGEMFPRFTAMRVCVTPLTHSQHSFLGGFREIECAGRLLFVTRGARDAILARICLELCAVVWEYSRRKKRLEIT